MASVGDDLDEWKARVSEADLRGAGAEVVRALSYERRPPAESLSTPLLYVCSDSHAYWVKHTTQHPQGVAGELIAGRALFAIGAGPSVIAVDVDGGVLEGVALPQGDAIAARTGVGLGSQSIENSFNTKEPGTKPLEFDVNLVDPASVGTAIAGLTSSWTAPSSTGSPSPPSQPSRSRGEQSSCRSNTRPCTSCARLRS